MNDLGRMLVLAGGALVLIGLVLVFAPRIPYLGRLPGDLNLRFGGVNVYFPLATSIILSIILTILLNLWLRR